MIDLHAHILPGLDDGSRTLEESIEMLRQASQSGVHTIVATSHANLGGELTYNIKQYRGALNLVRQAAQQNRIPIQILSGMEVFMTPDVMQKIQSGQLLSINHSNYYLVEFYFDISYKRMEELLQPMLQSGLVPVIAHPERYECVRDDIQRIKPLLEAGCHLQVNKGSVLGRFGSSVMDCALDLLEDEMVTCIASDAHRMNVRTAYMGDIQRYMEEEFSVDDARTLLYEQANRIIHSRPIW